MGWFGNLSRNVCAGQIQRDLLKLVEVANMADLLIGRTGQVSERLKQSVVEQQKQLLWDFNGPIELAEVKTRFLDPVLAHPGLSEGARTAVVHVFETAKKMQAK